MGKHIFFSYYPRNIYQIQVKGIKNMHNSESVCLFLAILVVVILFVVFKCKLDCSGGEEKFTKGTQDKPLIEGYNRACLAADCFGMQRTPVDYAMKYQGGWQRNPHWQTLPSVKYQPLDFGPVDLEADSRRLAANNGVLFQQYGNNWEGMGSQDMSIANDIKNRYDLTAAGNYGARQQLDDLYTPRFGPKGYTHTERTYNEPNPFYGPLYGGAKYLKRNLLSD